MCVHFFSLFYSSRSSYFLLRLICTLRFGEQNQRKPGDGNDDEEVLGRGRRGGRDRDGGETGRGGERGGVGGREGKAK